MNVTPEEARYLTEVLQDELDSIGRIKHAVERSQDKYDDPAIYGDHIADLERQEQLCRSLYDKTQEVPYG